MRIATILFTYNRPEHTQKVLDSLSINTMIPDKLFIFHDGLKANSEKEQISKWNDVERIISNVDWCDCHVITSQVNKGLANSIIYGVNYVFENYDAAIVLEDDCVTHKDFMRYMVTSLEKYESERKVFCINASDEPVDIPETELDAYFIGRINSCGWGTWKSRWDCFSKDYDILKRIVSDEELSKWLDVWGQDLEPTLYNNIIGKTDSWAVFWALSVIENKGLCLAPRYSFIDNIGFDGTGRHSGFNKIKSKMYTSSIDGFQYPNSIDVINNYENIFAYYYHWIDAFKREKYYKEVLLKWNLLLKMGINICDWFTKNNMKKVCVWGLGDIGKLLISDISKHVNVVKIIESVPLNESYGGIGICGPRDFSDNVDCIVIIPGYDIKTINKLLDIDSKLVPIDYVVDDLLFCKKN